MDDTIQEMCKNTRTLLEEVKSGVFALKFHEVFKGEQAHPFAHGEMQSNIMLAYRHLEDARMRLGKVCQHADGGVSILDKQ